MDFKQRLKHLRKEHGLTQDQVSKVLGYGYTAICNYELGRNEPSIKDIIKLAKFFDVSVDYLIGATDIMSNFKNKETEENEFLWFLNIYKNIPKNAQDELKLIINTVYNLYNHK